MVKFFLIAEGIAPLHWTAERYLHEQGMDEGKPWSGLPLDQ
jgi:hypothetical protein